MELSHIADQWLEKSSLEITSWVFDVLCECSPELAELALSSPKVNLIKLKKSPYVLSHESSLRLSWLKRGWSPPPLIFIGEDLLDTHRANYIALLAYGQDMWPAAILAEK